MKTIPIPEINYEYKNNYLIFGVYIEIYSNCNINLNVLDMYNNKNDKTFTSRKIYCIKSKEILLNILKKIDLNGAKTINSYTKSFYYEISNIYIRNNLSHIVIRDGNSIYFVYSTEVENEDNILWCIIREIIHRNTEDRGGVMLHSAALSSDNREGILILGSKGAGKTTLTTTLLEFNDYCFTSNERMLVRQEDKRAISIHYPLRFGVRNIINNPVLYNYILENYTHLIRTQNVTLEMIENYKNNKSLKEDSLFKIELEIEEFLDCFKKEYKPIIKPKILILPQISSEFKGYEITIIDKKEIIDAIKGQCYTPYDKTWAEPWIEKRMKNDNEIQILADSFINNISNEIIGIKMKYGFDLYELLKKKKKNYLKEKIEDIYSKRAN